MLQKFIPEATWHRILPCVPKSGVTNEEGERRRHLGGKTGFPNYQQRRFTNEGMNARKSALMDGLTGQDPIIKVVVLRGVVHYSFSIGMPDWNVVLG